MLVYDVPAEMVLKFFGLRGLKGYFSQKQNVFDFVVVMTSLPSIVQPLLAGSLTVSSNALSGVSAIRVFRLFRVFRIARLFHKVTSMRKLLTALTGSFTELVNVLFFIMFALMTIGIVATGLFARPMAPSESASQDLDSHGYSLYSSGHFPRYNYDSFFNSVLSLFIIMSGNCCVSAAVEASLLLADTNLKRVAVGLLLCR